MRGEACGVVIGNEMRKAFAVLLYQMRLKDVAQEWGRILKASRVGSDQCIHHRDDFYVGLGHPRCGTGFTASLLRTNGLKVGHEVVGADGIVSWMLAGEKYRNPYYDALGPLSHFKRIFLVARSPIAAIPSIIPENAPGRSLRFRRGIVRERFGTDLIGARGAKHELVRAVTSYVCWFEICLQLSPQLIFRIDREDVGLLSDFVGKELLLSENIDRNSRPAIRAGDISYDELVGLVPSEWINRLAGVCDKLGYEIESEEIRIRNETR